ncbi:hypothetical protein C8R48DRAFT_680130, partial [Suillus tomentosus]
ETRWAIPLRSLILLDDEGLRLIAGSDNGTVRLWNMKNDAQLPSLLHGNCIVRALTAHYDFTTHTCRIATGTAEQGPRTTVHLFETKELREAGATRSPQETPKLDLSLTTLSLIQVLNAAGNYSTRVKVDECLDDSALHLQHETHKL